MPMGKPGDQELDFFLNPLRKVLFNSQASNGCVSIEVIQSEDSLGV